MDTQKILKFLRKNAIIVGSVLVVVGSASFYFMRDDAIRLVDEQFDQLTMERTRMLRDLRWGDTLPADIEAMRSLVDNVEQRLFSPSDLASNKAYFYQLERTAGVELPSLQQVNTSFPGDAGKGSKKKGKKTAYQGISYALKVVGSYQGMIAFFRELEGGESLYRIHGFSISPSRGDLDGELLEMNLELQILGESVS